MLNLVQQQQQMYVESVQSSVLFKTLVDNYLLATEQSHKYDGWIHGSALDWSKDPAKQVEGIFKNYNSSPEMRRRSKAGDIYHREFQTVVDNVFGPGYAEFRMQIPDYCFSGTLDRFQPNTPVGNILFEFKTVTKYERDQAGADSIAKKVWRQHRNGDKLYTVENGDKLRFTDILICDQKFDEAWTEIAKRIKVRSREIKPVVKHLTQMFTYSYFLQAMYQQRVDLHALIYIAREDMEPVGEFYYSSAQEETQKYLALAAQNFSEVLTCFRQQQTLG